MLRVESVNHEWAEKWLDSVVAGGNTMSQRKLDSFERHGTSLESVTELAQAKGVHLLVIKDDQGTELVAASVNPFKILC